MNSNTPPRTSRKQIAFDLSQEDLAKHYPRPREGLSENYHTKAYDDIKTFFTKNNWMHNQGSVYASKELLTHSDVNDLLRKVGKEIPWLGLCVKEINITDILIKPTEWLDGFQVTAAHLGNWSLVKHRLMIDVGARYDVVIDGPWIATVINSQADRGIINLWLTLFRNELLRINDELAANGEGPLRNERGNIVTFTLFED